jgi:hypothetical protein
LDAHYTVKPTLCKNPAQDRFQNHAKTGILTEVSIPVLHFPVPFPSRLFPVPSTLLPMNPMRFLLLASLLVGCSPAMKIPGPTNGIGSDTKYQAYAAPRKAEAKAKAREKKAQVAKDGNARRQSRAFQSRVADAAEHYVKHVPRGFRDDCSGFAAAVYNRAGAPLTGNTRSMWELAERMGNTHRRKRPEVGDLIFFDNTWDRNKNGRWDDDLTHVAVVIKVDEDGTIRFAHSGTSKGRSIQYLNLLRPHDKRDESGKVLNEALRRKRDKDPRKAGYLTGELWRGFATFKSSELDSIAVR